MGGIGAFHNRCTDSPVLLFRETDPENSHSLFLAGYTGMRTVAFWKALADDPHLYTPRFTALTREDEFEHLHNHRTPRALLPV